jgi:voltage-gated potassium channel
MSYPSSRKGLYRLLEVGDTPAGRLLNLFLMMVILLSVIAVILESVPAYRELYGPWFYRFEIFSIIVFTVEYVARIWVCIEAPAYKGWRGRLRYAVTPMALVDLIAILPFYLGMFFDLDTRVLRALRLMRVFKLTRHSASMDLLLTVIRNEAATVASSLFVMLVIIVLAASGIYLIERDAQPQAFQSIPQAMWWAAVTLTTVGYGDVVPITVLGKIFGLVITIAGVGMVALPAGILASGFSQELVKRRAEFQLKVDRALTDGQISRDEMRELKAYAKQLGLGERESRMLIRRSNNRSRTVCPHCGKALT